MVGKTSVCAWWNTHAVNRQHPQLDPVQTNQRIALNADARFIPRDGGSFEDMLKLMVVAAGAVP